MDSKGIADALRKHSAGSGPQPLTDSAINRDIARALGAPAGILVNPGLTRYVRHLREGLEAAERAAKEAHETMRGLAIRKGSGVLSCALCNSVWRTHEGERHDDDCKAKP